MGGAVGHGDGVGVEVEAGASIKQTTAAMEGYGGCDSQRYLAGGKCTVKQNMSPIEIPSAT
jgi:hypothetical protein